MRKVLTLACLLAIAHHVTAQQCNSLPKYSETFVPECSAKDVYVKWPNYENQATYYKCNGIGNPVLAECPTNQYFCYVLQQCVSCSEVIPAVPCAQLKTQNPPNCVPISGVTTNAPPNSSTPTGPTLPTPNYPQTTKTTKTTTTRTTRSTTTKSPTKATPAPTTPSVPTPPTSSNTEIPPPPSPVTNDPNIPMPPTPGPTPPSVPVAPPNISSPPIAG